MIAARRFAIFNPVHTSNFIPGIDEQSCTGCGKCVNICPVEAMTLISANDPKKPNRKTAKLNEKVCLGCGLCIRACKEDSLELHSLPARVITPLNGTHKTVVMAIERGKLQHLLFDNKVLFSHRALAAVLGVILKLPPIKQIMASQQVKSRYLEALISYSERDPTQKNCN
jgi:ferredoxin